MKQKNTISSSLVLLLLQDRKLHGLEEGLGHPHGKHVHFTVHHDVFFLQKNCPIKQGSELVGFLLSKWQYYPVEKSKSLTIYF